MYEEPYYHNIQIMKFHCSGRTLWMLNENKNHFLGPCIKMSYRIFPILSPNSPSMAAQRIALSCD